MATAHVNGITINYSLEGDGPETVVLVNGLADDLTTWDFQMEALLGAGYRVLRFDNRGIGSSDAPAGPYTTELFAQDTKALVDELDLADFHLLGVSMGGMIAQEYAIANSSDLRSLTLACTYATPGPFCSRMFQLWEELAPEKGVPFVMRDVTLWAFNVPFFQEPEEELPVFDAETGTIDQPLEACLAQLHSIQQQDTTGRLGSISAPTL